MLVDTTCEPRLLTASMLWGGASTNPHQLADTVLVQICIYRESDSNRAVPTPAKDFVIARPKQNSASHQ